jgi:type IV pilus assembly protein PilY1
VPKPMFVAKDASGNLQPITGGVALGLDLRPGDANFGKLFVFFGTGQYMLSTDPSDKSVQTWYGIVDDGAQVSGRSVLKQRSIVVETNVGSTAMRSFSPATAGDMTGKKGWYLDWVSSAGTAGGERVISDSKFFGNAVVVTSIIPTTNVCVPGGDGYLNAIDPFTGGNLTGPFFDTNADGKFDGLDTLLSGTSKLSVGSVSPNNNLPSEPILIGNKLLTSGTSGEVRAVGAKPIIRNGRIAWREIVRQ